MTSGRFVGGCAAFVLGAIAYAACGGRVRVADCGPGIVCGGQDAPWCCPAGYACGGEDAACPANGCCAPGYGEPPEAGADDAAWTYESSLPEYPPQGPVGGGSTGGGALPQ